MITAAGVICFKKGAQKGAQKASQKEQASDGCKFATCSRAPPVKKQSTVSPVVQYSSDAKCKQQERNE